MAIFSTNVSFRSISVVTKYRYIGDTIIATPFLHQLRQAFPEAQVIVLTGKAAADVLSGCPYLDRIVTIDKPESLLGRLSETESDAVFLLNRSFSSALAARRAKVPVRIGFATEYRSWLLTNAVPYREDAREIDCTLDLLRAIGLQANDELPRLWVSEEEVLSVRERISSLGVSHPILLLQPAAKDPYKKEWGVHKFIELAKHIPYTPVLIGAEDESEACAKVAQHIQAINLCGKTSLREILALLSVAELLIANDTALVHAAVGVGTPTLTIHGPMTAGKWMYDTPPHRAIVAPTSERKRDRHVNRRALDALSAEPVIQAAKEMLAAVESASRP